MSDRRKSFDQDAKDVTEAKANFALAMAWEGTSRQRFVEDVKFGNADSMNGYQWPQDEAQARTIDRLPSLTINKTRQHCLQIINDARQNNPGVEIRPVGDGASYDAAEIYEGVVRHIEYISNAQLAYDAASWNQVFGGIGYFRVTTDYAAETGANAFNQEIFIRRVANPLNVLMDPDIQEFDGSDARWCFYFEDMPRKEAEALYPQLKDVFVGDQFGIDSWITKDKIRIAEYFRKAVITETLVMMPSGETAMMSELPKELRDTLPEDAPRRDITVGKVEWLKLVGDRVVERKEWMGKYIPFIRVVGEETVIDGQMDRKGHVRALRNPQQMYNYWSSAAVAAVSMHGKTPWMAPIAAIEGYETYYATANTVNHAYLPYNHVDDQGNPIPAPHRQEPVVMPPAFLQGMKVAQEEMMLVSGQYQAIMGSPSNETSGKAINARQRQGDNATYHYIDHLAVGIRFLGKILIDLIPKIYDTRRVLQVLGKDGSRQSVHIDPTMPKSMVKLGPDGQPVPSEAKELENPDFAAKVKTIFNPAVGQYDVIADIGPSYATSRQEAFNAFSQLMQQNQNAAAISLDLWAEAADFPGSDTLAKRARAMLPPAAQGGADPQVQQLQQHMQQGAEQALQHIDGLEKQIAELTKKLGDKMEDLSREKYEAETKRLSVIRDIDPDVLKPFVRAEATSIIGHPIMEVIQAHRMAEQATEAAQPVMQTQGASGAPMPPQGPVDQSMPPVIPQPEPMPMQVGPNG